MKPPKFAISSFLLMLALTSCNVGSSNETTTAQEAPAAVAEEPSSDEAPPVDDSFSEAVHFAMSAAEAAQTAQTTDEWENVAFFWSKAIESMKAVPESSENYQTAQQKATEYQPNLEYALSNSSIEASCTSESLKFYVQEPIDKVAISFAVRTNLPEGTEVGFNLSGYGYTAQSKGVVSDGYVESEGFSNRGKALAGEYTLEILSYFNSSWQSEELMAQLASYSSPCIQSEEGIGEAIKVLRTEIPVSFGNVEAAQQAVQQEAEKAKAIFSEAQSLLDTGKRNLSELRGNPNAPVCFSDLQERMNRARNLSSRADKLQGQQWFELKVAVNNLVSCSTCEEVTVETYCQEAEKFLQSFESNWSE